MSFQLKLFIEKTKLFIRSLFSYNNLKRNVSRFDFTTTEVPCCERSQNTFCLSLEFFMGF